MIHRTHQRALTLLSVIALGITACAPAAEQGMTEAEILAAAAELHPTLITIDTHIDIGLDYATGEMNPCLGTDSKVDIPKMRAGGLDVAFLAAYVGQRERTPENYAVAQEQAMTKFRAIHRLAEEMCPELIEIAYTADDIERIHAQGKLMTVISIENGFVIGRDLSLLQTYYDLGARAMTLTHGGHNDIGDSSGPRPQLGDEEEEHGGLSEFGRQVVVEMNRLGMIVDVSHVSKKTMMQAVELSRAPIVATHSCVSALSDVDRNMDDEQLLALRDNGGVIHITAVGSFVKQDPPEKREARDALFAEFEIRGYRDFDNLTEERRAELMARMEEIENQWPRASLQDMVDHIDHAVNLIGVDHVGIGSDFDGGGGVTGWDDASESMNITAELLRRGYSNEDIRKIWGGNFLRVLREAERVAAEMQAGGAS